VRTGVSKLLECFFALCLYNSGVGNLLGLLRHFRR